METKQKEKPAKRKHLSIRYFVFSIRLDVFLNVNCACMRMCALNFCTLQCGKKKKLVFRSEHTNEIFFHRIIANFTK